jgi:integrase/recombinase XerD
MSQITIANRNYSQSEPMSIHSGISDSSTGKRVTKNPRPSFDKETNSCQIKNTIMDDAVLDFILSRRGMNCSPRTISWYQYLLKRIVKFLQNKDITEPEMITRCHVNAFLTELSNQGKSSSYIHGYARVIRTFLGFLLKEGYISEKVNFDMPIYRRRRQRVYTEEEMRIILNSCEHPRDKAIITLLVDSGIRLSEVLSLNWGDIDFNTGAIKIDNGKGGKFRTVVAGINAQRALIKYRSSLAPSSKDPVFQTIHGYRFSESGLRSWFNRLSKKAGIHITPHALRRTFATMALKAGMDLIRLQQLMGHADLDTTRQYIQVLDVDLIEAHKNHSPIEYILKGNKNN